MNQQTRNDIIHRHQLGQSMRSIARVLGISRYAVKQVIDQVQQARQGKGLAATRLRKSPLLDPFDETIRGLLARYPQITATRMLEELRRDGYQGSYTILRQRLDLRANLFHCFSCRAGGNQLDLWAAFHGRQLHPAAKQLCHAAGIAIPWLSQSDAIRNG